MKKLLTALATGVSLVLGAAGRPDGRGTRTGVDDPGGPVDPAAAKLMVPSFPAGPQGTRRS